ncbi:hypothetical protein LEP1GSC050_1807 [Leptospira broomii serovar Hurstbridge str. 5399]|uniref:Uncharacterized protein n=1 Tax=Leptospira broomii serovar Hurstbridge str. 5399 TaxID=1049789 RepID=T0GKL4_9LEPT|nr:hypothetical protein [Leptospira broomii]EQA47334.1 hypothetical protein LEP1GSC050_1807 [Leptospira broomii serovar Hurstbridge str. 5399]
MCEHKNIPDRLHTNGKKEDQDFGLFEKLYRRFPPGIPRNNKNGRYVIDSDELSLNREKYSNDPTDVLFRTTTGDYLSDYGILQFSVELFSNLNLQHDTEEILFTFKIAHKPEACMYPHSIIVPYKNGKQVDRISSNFIKTAYREKLWTFAKSFIIRESSPPSVDSEVNTY